MGPKKSENSYRLRVKLDLDGVVMGSGKADLLRKIESLGSISAAAREMDINYRRAWFLLETLNTALGRPVVVTTTRGASGGGASLTPVGQALLEAYDHCQESVETHSQNALDTLRRVLKK